MSTELLSSCLKLLEDQGVSSSIFHENFMRLKRDLLASEEVAMGLVVLIGHLKDENDDAVMLFGLLLDEARMGLENDADYAKGFLETVEMAIGAGLAAGSFEQHHLLGFAGQYRRVGLPVPATLMVDPDKMTVPYGAEEFDLSENIESIARDILAQGGGALDLFTALDEMSAALPEEMLAGFVNHLVTLDGAIFERCALYFILSGGTVVQEATLAGLSHRLEATGLQGDTMVFLPIIRGWLGAGSAQKGVDGLIKHARRRGCGGKIAFQGESKIREIVATITDGAGAQNIAILVEQGKQFFVAMLLTKDGYGIKDAFVIPCKSQEEAESTIMQPRLEGQGADISATTLEILLEAAIADGIRNNCPPAPGILDVMDTCDLFNLRPQALSLQGLLEFIDPERKIQDGTSQALGRWTNNDMALDFLEPLTDSWFEDNQETRKVIATAKTRRSAEIGIWKYLETRRDLWAKRFLQTAAMLKDADRPREWQTLTASAYGLMNNRPLKRIPLMEDIVELTIDAAYDAMW
jgi:hypothetical protein